MIDRIVVENFKNLRKVDLSLGRMNLFIGANASGKSNFLDALRVLQGIGNGFTISEVLDGKPKSATSEVWDGIRGGSSKACSAGADGSGAVTIEAHGTLEDGTSETWELLIAFSPADGRVTRERFTDGWGTVYDSAEATNYEHSSSLWVCYYPERQGRPPHLDFERARPVLGQLASCGHDVRPDHVEVANKVAVLLADAQRLDISPPALREYSQPPRVRRLGDRGENFAALVQTICQDPKAKDAYLAWLRQLRPAEVDDVGTLKGAVGEPLFMLRENDVEFPAPVLSDGTLRFAAIAAAFFQPDMPALMTIEEIENGVHASRLRLLVELLRSQTKPDGPQVFATTHSPTALAWVEDDEYRTTFFCKREESTGESTIRPLADVPHFLDAVSKHPLSELLAEGWLESAP